MATTSLNGWTVLKPTSTLLKTGLVPLTTRKIRMHKDVLPLFLALAFDYDEWIAPIDQGPLDDAGYCYRMATSGDGWSNHASATALDLNWTKEGAQRATNRAFWAKNDIRLHATHIKRIYHVVDWGGDWSKAYWDPMHWEIGDGVNRAHVLQQIKFLGIDAKGVRHNNWDGVPLLIPRGVAA
jgi:hypothetical protein